MSRPRLLDAYCCAGGAGMGYHQAGFDVVGVDIAPQKNYPFEFHQGDAIKFIAEHGHEFDAIHFRTSWRTSSAHLFARTSFCVGSCSAASSTGIGCLSPTGNSGNPHTSSTPCPGQRPATGHQGTRFSISGNCSPIALAREVMEIDWTTRHELAESIPPYYSKFIGHQLAAHTMASVGLGVAA